MIWEVDDDCDKRVNWNEFQAMFMRCRNDKTGVCAFEREAVCAHSHQAVLPGYEPRRLYNVTEFLMNDKDGSGKVSVEEVMQILFLRYGRQLLDSVRIGVASNWLSRTVRAPPTHKSDPPVVLAA